VGAPTHAIVHPVHIGDSVHHPAPRNHPPVTSSSRFQKTMLKCPGMPDRRVEYRLYRGLGITIIFGFVALVIIVVCAFQFQMHGPETPARPPAEGPSPWAAMKGTKAEIMTMTALLKHDDELRARSGGARTTSSAPWLKAELRPIALDQPTIAAQAASRVVLEPEPPRNNHAPRP
jgi:hypothetical protein